VAAGDELVVPPGRPHVDPYNPGGPPVMLAQPDTAILAAGLPAALQRPALRLLAPVLRRRGYRPAAGLRQR
jgi:hypothetical protein